jgi:hypothetical protein
MNSFSSFAAFCEIRFYVGRRAPAEAILAGIWHETSTNKPQ